MVKLRPTKEAENVVKAHPRRIHVVFVLDVSGSMCGEKLETAKEALLRRYRKDLSDDDLFSIVTFSSSVKIVVDKAQKRTHGDIENMVRSIKCESATDLYSGINMGWDLLKKTPSGYLKRMVVITDGVPTVGITDKDKIVDLVKRIRDDGVSVDVYGIGDDYDYSLCDSMAKAGGGWMRHVTKPDELEKVSKTAVDRSKGTVVDKLIMEVDLVKGASLEAARLLSPQFVDLDVSKRPYVWDLGTLSIGDVYIITAKMRIDSGFPEGRQKLGEVRVGTIRQEIYVDFVKGTAPFREDPAPRLFFAMSERIAKIVESLKMGIDNKEEAELLRKILDSPEAKSVNDPYFVALAQRYLATTKVEAGTKIDQYTKLDRITKPYG